MKVTAPMICSAMRKLYSQPEWAILFEVRNATGFAANRSADALAMSLWPSRGLEVHGFEIKVSRSDWYNERRKPEKAETIAAFCDRWWIVAPPDIIPEEEIPPAWGHRTFDGKKWLVRKDAAKTEARPLSREFLAAVLRRAGKTDEAELLAAIEEKDSAREEAFQERVKAEVERRAYDAKDLFEAVAKFEAASGIKISDRWPTDAGNVGEAVKVVMAVQKCGVYHGAEQLARNLAEASVRIREALAETGFGKAAA